MSENELCEHESFSAHVEVNRLQDIGRYAADVRIGCAQCGVAMVFLGVPRGLDLDGTSVSFDGTELRLGIAPQGESSPPINGVRGFSIGRARRQEPGSGNN